MAVDSNVPPMGPLHRREAGPLRNLQFGSLPRDRNRVKVGLRLTSLPHHNLGLISVPLICLSRSVVTASIPNGSYDALKLQPLESFAGPTIAYALANSVLKGSMADTLLQVDISITRSSLPVVGTPPFSPPALLL